MATDRFRTLIVDDSEQWRRLVCSILQKHPEVQVVGEVADGPEAVQKARELQPDLILLDIGLPTLNGIEAARQIRTHSPRSKILFVSQETSAAVVQEALGNGKGYMTKVDFARDLPTALHAVLRDEQFVGSRYSALSLAESEKAESNQTSDQVAFSLRRNGETGRRHEVGFYRDDQLFLDDVTQFVGSALEAGAAAIVALTEHHRKGLHSSLRARGVDVEAAIEQSRYIALDAAEALTQFMCDGMPDTTRLLEAFGSAIHIAANAVKESPGRIAFFGECVHLLWAQGNPEAAIRMEQLGNELIKTHDVDIRCAYFLNDVSGGMDDDVFRRICAEHSAVYSPCRPNGSC